MLRRQDQIGDELKDLSGLCLRRPGVAFAMLVFMLSLGGIPPTAGFMGKFWLFGAAIEAGYVWLAVIGVLNSAISLYYYVRVVVFMWIKEDAVGSAITLAPGIAVALAIAVAGTILLGIYPAPLFTFAENRRPRSAARAPRSSRFADVRHLAFIRHCYHWLFMPSPNAASCRLGR